jgi:hypothetical protein
VIEISHFVDQRVVDMYRWKEDRLWIPGPKRESHWVDTGACAWLQLENDKAERFIDRKLPPHVRRQPKTDIQSVEVF